VEHGSITGTLLRKYLIVRRSSAASAWAAVPWAVLGAALVAVACSSDDTPSTPSGGGAGKASAAGGAGGRAPAGGASGSAGTGGSIAAGTGGSTGGTAGSSAGHGGTAGAQTGGSAGVGAGAPGGTGGMGAGGAAGSGIAGTGGGAGAGAGMGGGAGSGAGAGGTGGGMGSCPAGVTGMPMLTGTPTRVASVPPADSFNMNNGTFGIIEGPVWTGSELYVSELTNMPYEPQSNDMKMARLLKVTPDGQTSIVVADSGTNGLALAADGSLVAGVHKDGTVKRFTLPGGAATTLVNGYMNIRFNSPNDLAIHSTGTIYFSDPSYNAPTPPPQSAMRVYRVAPGGSTAEPIPSSASPDTFQNPNGVTLSLAEDFLYVAGAVGRRYPVMADGTLGAGADFAAASGGDGMVIDCAGNLYVALASTQNVAVFTPAGDSIGMIKVTGMQAVTNLAFGGADRKTLYITGLGNDKGLFQLPLNLPGRPY
jgi:gluconolactonase